MPTLSNMNLPTPKNWEEFEEMTLDALKLKWDSPNLQKNGRQGQSQNGVDVFGEDYLSHFVGVQCKKYVLNLTLKTINEEIKKAEKFSPKIAAFYIATTYSTDANLQKKIRLLSKERAGKNRFPVGIFFWNDIIQELITNEKIFNKHYPQISLQSFQKKNYKRLFSILDLSFLRLNFKHFTDVIFGEAGLLVQEDPRKIEIITSIVKSACLAVCSESEQTEIFAEIDSFILYLKKENKEIFYWKISDDNANLIAGKIKSIEHSLKEDELLVFKIGELLANWCKYEFDKKEEVQISAEFLSKLKKYIRQLNDNKLPVDIKKLIKYYKNDCEDISLASIADDIYNKLRQLLIETELIN